MVSQEIPWLPKEQIEKGGRIEHHLHIHYCAAVQITQFHPATSCTLNSLTRYCKPEAIGSNRSLPPSGTYHQGRIGLNQKGSYPFYIRMRIQNHMFQKAAENLKRSNRDALPLPRSIFRLSIRMTMAISVPNMSLKPD